MEFHQRTHFIKTVHLSPTRPCSTEGSYNEPQNKMRQSKKMDNVSFHKKSLFNKKRNDEIILKREDLNYLLSNLNLAEIEEIQTGYEIEEKNLESSENYFEAFGDKEKIHNLSPWTPDGPILKSTPSLLEMSKMIENGNCTCLLLHCEEEVFTGMINLLKANPWYFMCQRHRRDTSDKYGYGPKKIL